MNQCFYLIGHVSQKFKQNLVQFKKYFFFFFSWKFLRDLCFPFYLINFYKNVFSVLCANIVIISLNCLLILREDGWNVFILTKKEIINLQSPTHNSLFSYLVRFWEVGWPRTFQHPIIFLCSCHFLSLTFSSWGVFFSALVNFHFHCNF